jgi:3-oxoacyl-[acyl-carrier protein] reductase
MYTNKTVLVTGSSRGVGLEIAKHFLNNGATVLGMSRGENLQLSHPSYRHYAVDLGNPEAITTCFRREICRDVKQIDILINNAAVMTSQYAMILPMKNVMDMINVNLLGVFTVSREVAKLMRGKSPSRIINIGSMASSLEPMGDSVYAATKSAIITLADVMAKELSSYNVTCNTLGITAIETDMLNSHNDTAKVKIKEIIDALPIPRMATADDILNVIDFFASDRSSYITGQTIYLGGIN